MSHALPSSGSTLVNCPLPTASAALSGPAGIDTVAGPYTAQEDSSKLPAIRRSPVMIEGVWRTR